MDERGPAGGSTTPTARPGTRRERREATEGAGRGPGWRRFRWWIAGGAAVVVVALAAGYLLVVRPRQAVLHEANAYFGDLADGDYAGAYDRLCAATRRDVPEATFVDSMKRDFSGVFAIDGYGANPFGVDIDGDRAGVDFSVSYENARSSDVTLHLRREDGTWRPCLAADQFTQTSVPPSTTRPAPATTAAASTTST